MDELKLQRYITDWLTKYHKATSHQEILTNACAIGSKSKRWTEAIQRYVKGECLQEPQKSEIKRACKALLERDMKT